MCNVVLKNDKPMRSKGCRSVNNKICLTQPFSSSRRRTRFPATRTWSRRKSKKCWSTVLRVTMRRSLGRAAPAKSRTNSHAFRLHICRLTSRRSRRRRRTRSLLNSSKNAAAAPGNIGTDWAWPCPPQTRQRVFAEKCVISWRLTVANLADMAGDVSVNVRAEPEEGFDKSKLENGVMEPLRESELID